MRNFLIITRTLMLIPALALIIFAALALTGCNLAMPKPGAIPTAAELCGPFRGLFTMAASEAIGSTSDEIRAACKLAKAVTK